MNTPCDDPSHWSRLREQIIGLEERSIRKSYYPELRRRVTELEHFRQLVDRINDLVVSFDLSDNRITDANRSFLLALGCSFDQLPHLSLRDICPDLVIRITEVSEAWNRSDPLVSKPFVTGFRSLEGNLIPVEASFSLNHIQNQMLGIIVAREIGERLRAEKALSFERERFETLLQQAPFGMLLVDQTGRFTYANFKFTEIVGYDLNDVPNGRTWFRRAYPNPEYRKQVISSWKNDLERYRVGEHRPRVFDVVCKDGRKKVIHFIPVNLETGENLVACEDITERMMMEDQLRHAQKMEAVGTLAGGVAHDFNNLLQGIGGYAQLLLMDKSPANPDYVKLKYIEKLVERAATLVRQLLLFSRKADSERRPLDLVGEVASAVRILERTLPRMIEIETHSTGRLWTIQADPVQIEQVLLNLGVNAADAMPDQGKLCIQMQNMTLDIQDVHKHFDARPGNYVLLTVSDTGIGMDPETVKHIFEPFFTTKSIGRGTGLGLASVYGIVKSYGGHIQCHSEPDRGTTFRIYFPAVAAQNADTVPDATDIVTREGTETILVVDDEPDIRNLISQMLRRFGYTVIHASNGEEALRCHAERKESIALTILDLGMPGMGGFRCLQELLHVDAQARILIASGYSADVMVKKALKSGAVGFIGKPYQLTELMNRIRDILDERS